MANMLPIALQNAKNAVKLLDRALNDLEQHFGSSALDRDKLQSVYKIRSSNGSNGRELEKL